MPSELNEPNYWEEPLIPEPHEALELARGLLPEAEWEVQMGKLTRLVHFMENCHPDWHAEEGSAIVDLVCELIRSGEASAMTEVSLFHILGKAYYFDSGRRLVAVFLEVWPRLHDPHVTYNALIALENFCGGHRHDSPDPMFSGDEDLAKFVVFFETAPEVWRTEIFERLRLEILACEIPGLAPVAAAVEGPRPQG